MILVVLGTHELPFTRLLDEVDRLKQERIIKEEVIVQHGHTPYKSEQLTLKPFVSYEEMDALYEDAGLVITHAGTGSVITGLRKGKTVIAAPRLKKYGEHNDDHQLQLVEAFTAQGHILSWNDGEKLEAVIKQAKDFIPKPFQSGKQRLQEILTDFIDHA
ncbi:PssE/Cps14G family polysaccharide biosynthesis glycosyltransferase [Sediminibacillus halophilus]|uniref:UDP-N-acetylglucosamine transferase subunit ALG13 n=1 Tax=Sediminibacillus halophilus TaxID=482461 RepID=A0A1G9U4C9_9BACI|nr:PssE/Cps14G family polysaccharide biosynthesis glycosyltransferase [Sediminibacillus halophilus]SDM54787.1 UDP-N-acetylglucosamine transferase subunit ALG13 [Sediminibacillus halophilus]